jgi:hypothetical protein
MDPDLNKHIKFVKVRAQSWSCKMSPVGTGLGAAGGLVAAAQYMHGMRMVCIKAAAAAQLYGVAGTLDRLPLVCDSCAYRWGVLR